jgi:DNA-binding NtrC family response regulator
MTGGEDRTILHVDDDPQFLRIVETLLEARGYEVVSLANPHDVIDTLLRRQIRLVLLDVDMPEMGGIDLLRDIKAFDGGLQVLMLTGLVTTTTVMQSMRYGAEACFFKPLEDVDTLVEAIEETFQKIDRWWATLKELTARRRQPTPSDLAQPSVPCAL